MRGRERLQSSERIRAVAPINLSVDLNTLIVSGTGFLAIFFFRRVIKTIDRIAAQVAAAAKSIGELVVWRDEHAKAHLSESASFSKRIDRVEGWQDDVDKRGRNASPNDQTQRILTGR